MPESKVANTEISAVVAGLKGRCPECGKGKLFKGFLTLRDECDECGTNYSFADSGDGPAVFVIMLVGFIVVGLVLAVELSYQPPIWVHLVLWLPLTVLLSVGVLRPLKGMMIGAQYHHSAHEGELDDSEK
ncbi:MAG: DUF983 domain-containing protein [Rhodobacteraceae bacterium]|nr:DUF983 domain-containing protein [Paracoccaceae bacterium]